MNLFYSFFIIMSRKTAQKNGLFQKIFYNKTKNSILNYNLSGRLKCKMECGKWKVSILFYNCNAVPKFCILHFAFSILNLCLLHCFCTAFRTGYFNFSSVFRYTQNRFTFLTLKILMCVSVTKLIAQKL